MGLLTTCPLSVWILTVKTASNIESNRLFNNALALLYFIFRSACVKISGVSRLSGLVGNTAEKAEAQNKKRSILSDNGSSASTKYKS